MVKAKHVLAHSATPSRCKPPAVLITDVKSIILAAHRGLQLSALLARRTESETVSEFASGFSSETIAAVRDLRVAADDVERYFPSAPVIAEMLARVDRIVALAAEFCGVLEEVCALYERDR